MTFLGRFLGGLSRVEPSSTPSVSRVTPALADSRANLILGLRDHVAAGSRGRLRAEDVHGDGLLFDRGYLDSFSYVELLAAIEETYGVRIEDSELAGHLTTIEAIADHILRKQAPPVE